MNLVSFTKSRIFREEVSLPGAVQEVKEVRDGREKETESKRPALPQEDDGLRSSILYPFLL